MAQADYIISNQTFPNTRADINNHLEAIATNNSGTSAPTTQYAGQFWIDTTSTTWTLYIHDGTDDIQFATIDTSANTVNFTDSALDVVTDTTPQLGGDLDLNSNDITGTGNINITGNITASGNLTSVGIDDNATSTAITIDSSENVLVGKTSTDQTVAGTTLFANGKLAPTVDSDTVIYANRETNDGAIIDLRKDGTTVGSIATVNSTLVIGNGDTGILFSGASDVIIPRNSSTASRDNAIGLGDSGNRFKDLYLGGSVYLGGTGSANALDDYEEGTWTPTLISSDANLTIPGYGIQTGRYTKIGRIVIVYFILIVSGTPSGGTGELRISGLPFNCNNNVNAVNQAGFFNSFTAQTDQSEVLLSSSGNNNYISVNYHEFNGSTAMTRYPANGSHNANPRIDGTLVYEIN